MQSHARIFLIIVMIACMSAMADVPKCQEKNPETSNPAQETKQNQEKQQDQEKHKQDEVGNKIYEYYKNCVVSIETTAILKSGRSISWSGAGGFIDDNGSILTASHVAKEEKKEIFIPFIGRDTIVRYTYWVTLHGQGKKYKAKSIGTHKYKDYALLQIVDFDAVIWKCMKLGNSDAVKVGDRVFALGEPLGLSNTMTAGTISAVHRILNFNYIEDFIQTDAPINPGNSGGPLIDTNGEVIGINVAGVRGADGLGFAVPVNLIDIEQLKKGDVKMPYLGAEAMIENFARSGTFEEPSFGDIKYLNEKTGIDNLKILITLAKLTERNYAIVEQLDESIDAPAFKAGLQKGDIIARINDKKIASGMDVRKCLSYLTPGAKIEIEAARVDKNGLEQSILLNVELQELTKEQETSFYRDRRFHSLFTLKYMVYNADGILQEECVIDYFHF